MKPQSGMQKADLRQFFESDAARLISRRSTPISNKVPAKLAQF